MTISKLLFKNKKILVVGAHPDDNDFTCGGTVAKAVSEGAEVYYLIATSGQRGGGDHYDSWEEIALIRRKEQNQAAKVLGVKEVFFLNYLDGEVIANIDLKEKIVIYIRRLKPEIVITMDPSFYYFKNEGFINHSDHRAIGEATIDAVYPLSRDRLSFPEHIKLGLKPHKVSELLLQSFTGENANLFVDVTESIDTKIKAISKHKSQVKNISKFEKRLKHMSSSLKPNTKTVYNEAFVRLTLPR